MNPIMYAVPELHCGGQLLCSGFGIAWEEQYVHTRMSKRKREKSQIALNGMNWEPESRHVIDSSIHKIIIIIMIIIIVHNSNT